MKINKLIYTLIITLILTLFTPAKIKFNDYSMTAIFTVMGIMFSIGMGLMITFNPNGIKNKEIINKLRTNLKQVRTSFILYFSLSTILYISESILRSDKKNIISYEFIIFNFSTFTLLFILFSTFYFIFNYIKLQSLNDEIFDKTNDR